jgi:hypothetical protein
MEGQQVPGMRLDLAEQVYHIFGHIPRQTPPCGGLGMTPFTVERLLGLGGDDGK